VAIKSADSSAGVLKLQETERAQKRPLFLSLWISGLTAGSFNICHFATAQPHFFGLLIFVLLCVFRGKL